MWIQQPAPEQFQFPASCRGCGAKILWCQTKANKSVPVNIDFKILSTQKAGNVELMEIRNEDSHFATCSKRDQFRRKK